jgi:hypothetical protein
MTENLSGFPKGENLSILPNAEDLSIFLEAEGVSDFEVLDIGPILIGSHSPPSGHLLRSFSAGAEGTGVEESDELPLERVWDVVPKQVVTP